jgi:peptide subunit release factor 1 (eRF1)
MTTVFDRASVFGLPESLRALVHNQAVVLVLAEGYEPMGQRCALCGAINVSVRAANNCPVCGGLENHPVNLRDEMLRLAERNGCEVITVKNDFTALVDGVGCLLREGSAAQNGKVDANTGVP